LQREEDPVTVFMGVPTMYSYLLSAYDAMGEGEQAHAQLAASRLRLTVSGSAACPVPIMQRWEELSGGDLCRPRWKRINGDRGGGRDSSWLFSACECGGWWSQTLEDGEDSGSAK